MKASDRKIITKEEFLKMNKLEGLKFFNNEGMISGLEPNEIMSLDLLKDEVCNEKELTK